jgi:hypothetical protein
MSPTSTPREDNADQPAQPETQTAQPETNQNQKLPRHALLHYLRCMVERYHRDRIMRQSVRFWGPPIVSLENVNRMESLHIDSKQ